MLSKNKISFINSLKNKKYREIHRQFVAEGSKLVVDLLKSSFTVHEVYAQPGWLETFDKHFISSSISIIEIREEEMGRITALSTPSPVLAVVNFPERELMTNEIASGLTLVLDDMHDPGNLGTIVRIADWFGIGHIVCSLTCVDLYNPKVVQSTMGSIARVQVHYFDLCQFLAGLPGDFPVYGTFLEGENMYDKKLAEKGVIIIGSESNGISPEVEKFVSDRLYIPAYPPNSGGAESLNASVATAIVCAEFRRRMLR
jgi:TrmH family RNA methyltransferase